VGVDERAVQLAAAVVGLFPKVGVRDIVKTYLVAAVIADQCQFR
jgi:hypothetical protein